VAVALFFSVSDLLKIIASFRDGLHDHCEAINRLNVFPVPDGDTGTNMFLTVKSVAEELEGIDPIDKNAVCGAISHGSLMGARGNSGVILSQILRGLAKSFEKAETIDGSSVATALKVASEAADSAVMKPVEGTILTVVREAARGAASSSGGLVSVLEGALSAAEIALARTPEQLEILATAGVVDAGGAGFLHLLHGMLQVADGRALPEAVLQPEIPNVFKPASSADLAGELRYEVMYLLDAPDSAISEFKNVWAGLGDSIVVVGGDGLWNCHIHTNDIGPAIEAAIEIGRPRQIRVSDLAEEVIEEQWVRTAAAEGISSDSAKAQVVPCAVVAVSPAPGIGRIFHSLGVQVMVVGGQTMNPSTAELLDAVERAPAEQVIILPNNSNILAVAGTVDSQTEKKVIVVATTSVPEGFASLLAYDPEADAEANAEQMADISSTLVVGEVTKAVRSTSTSVGEVETDDWIGLDREGVRSINKDLTSASIALLSELITENHEIVSIIEGLEAGDAETRTIEVWLAEHYPNVETEVHHGEQDHYPYFFGIE
jgi:DAK2 domain fusion protein YloV|tara:strand:- start:7254 stop:8888 length:1635 start_codon:yes stop_codon:yes gene_type:complete